MPRITIITPTLNRDLRVIERCMRSVTNQTLDDWEHIVCSDGQSEPGVERLVQLLGDKRRTYMHLPRHTGHFGAGVRSALTDVAAGEYLSFLDDDNIIFPKFCEHMVNALDCSRHVGLAICQIVQCTPLPPEYGLAPIVINGIPPRPNNIDTLQVVVRKEAMQKTGWSLTGYISDGHTYQRLSKDHDWIAVDEVLGMKI